jgi:hypothetical protein
MSLDEGLTSTAQPTERSRHTIAGGQYETSVPSAYDRTTAHTIHDSVCSTPTATAGQPAKRQASDLHASGPQGLLEPDAWERARPVLRGRRRSNAPSLPGQCARLLVDLSLSVVVHHGVAGSCEEPVVSLPPSHDGSDA